MKKIPVETYSRVVGYFRPIRQWNKGKQEEFNDRIEYSKSDVSSFLNNYQHIKQKM